jgi:hypothetical protein
MVNKKSEPGKPRLRTPSELPNDILGYKKDILGPSPNGMKALKPDSHTLLRELDTRLDKSG